MGEERALVFSPLLFVFLLGGFKVRVLCCFALFPCMLPHRRAAIISMLNYIYTALFIFWNPKMLKHFYGKQNIFSNC